MRKMFFTLVAVTSVLVLTGSVRAGGNSPQNTEGTPNAMVAAEATDVDMDTTRFVDANNDGINDIGPRLTREQVREMDQERRENRGQLMNQSMAGLSKAQKDEIKQLRTNMRRQGATPDQIHMAVGEKVRSYGVAVPEEWNLTAREYAVSRRMTDEERAEVQMFADSLRQQGQTPAQIRAAVQRKYQAKAGVTSRRPPRPSLRDDSGAAASDSARGAAALERAQKRHDGAAMRDSMRVQPGQRAGEAGQSGQRRSGGQQGGRSNR